jgi:hypothetical protein
LLQISIIQFYVLSLFFSIRFDSFHNLSYLVLVHFFIYIFLNFHILKKIQFSTLNSVFSLKFQFQFFFSKFIFTMDPITIWRVLLIWMMLSLTLGNCALFKSWVCNFFLHNDPSIGFHFLLECNDTISKQTFGFYYHGPKCKYTFDHINFVNKIPSHNKGFKPLYKLHEINIITTLLPIVKLKVFKVVIFKNL